jgi:hypothetical protein
MIQFTVTAAGRQPFTCTIHPGERRVESFLPPEIKPLDHSAIPGQACICKREGPCKLLDALVPILLYFSAMHSYEMVTIERLEGEDYGRISRTAQEACFILCTHAMIHSSCDFFGDDHILFDHYRMDLSTDTMLLFILTINLLRWYLRKDPRESLDLNQSMQRVSQAVRGRLLHILAEARGMQQQDAALNAVNTMFNLHQLSLIQLEEHAAELGRRLRLV